MIITCEKCSKNFNINDNLIPDAGRLLQCGSCDHKWFYNKPIKKHEKLFTGSVFCISDFKASFKAFLKDFLGITKHK